MRQNRINLQPLIISQIKESVACSLPSAGDRSYIILGVPRSNHKERGEFKDNVILKKKKKKTFGEDEE